MVEVQNVLDTVLSAPKKHAVVLRQIKIMYVLLLNYLQGSVFMNGETSILREYMLSPLGFTPKANSITVDSPAYIYNSYIDKDEKIPLCIIHAR